MADSTRQITVRAASDADLPQISALCERELHLDRTAAGYPALLMRRPRSVVVATCGEALLGAAFGSVTRSPVPDGVIDLLAVDGSARRAGIARRLVAHLEAEFLGRGCAAITVQGNSPCYLWPGVDLRYTPAIGFFEALGFSRRHCFVNMDVDLFEAPLDTAEDEKRLADSGIRVQRARPEDKAALQAWVGSGVGGAEEAWVEEIEVTLDNPEAGCLVATHREEVIGFVAYGLNQLHIVGPLAVDPAHRRAGLGTVLMKRCLAEQRDRLGLRTAEIGWAGPVGLFSKTLTATINRAFWQYTRPLAATP
ncbi:GNAT family N-acetyltransferase [Actinomadura litoris]|uniref:GNAT family N-acetyltransferase n=1 Tax=Actinomadura litoris TaxID=2678616 RepID=A0A7K1L4Y6_9ACTN|nr:GNAT family N-acetyltransferase [Actinomadura litoris]MUN39487.1 GNAT family N-acetyltransferase [Actinomadura litoris]